jgi:hypothetical protein
MSLSASGDEFFPVEDPGGLDQRAGFKFVFARPDVFQRFASLSDCTAVRKPRPPMLTPSIGVFGTGDLPRGVQHRAVAAEDEQQINFARQRRGVRHGRTFQFRQRAVISSQTNFRPPLMRRAAARTLAAHADFSALPTRPMRWKWSADFFNQRQKFFVAGRAEQGRFNHTAPAKASLRVTQILATPPAHARGWRNP